MRYVFYSRLAVLRCIADILCMRAFNQWELFAQSGDHVLRLVEAERGLRDVSDARRIRHFQMLYLFRSSDDLGHVRGFAESADDFIVVVMSDQNNAVAAFGVLHSFHVDLGDQRTGSVNHLQVAQLALFANAGRNAVRTVNEAMTVRNLVDFVDEDRSLGLQLFHDVAVVDDLPANIDRRAKGIKRNADNINGTNYPGAESPRLQQQ